MQTQREKSMLGKPCQRGLDGCWVKREVLYHAESQKNCTSCSAAGHRKQEEENMDIRLIKGKG